MTEAFALSCLGKFGEIVMGNIGDCLVAPIRRQFTYMCCFNSNISELETQMQKLETTRQEVQLGVDGNRRNVRVVGPTVEAWLKRGNEVTTEVEGIIQDKAKVKEGCLNGWCPNLKLRYSLSRKAVKKTTVVVDLQKDGVQYTQLFYPPPPPCLETIPNRDFMVFNSRRLTMEDIIKALTDDGTTLIGICGLPGVGKTKMVQEVRKRAKEEKLFDEVAFVAVGQYPDLTKVQNSIGDIFGLEDLKKLDDATTRASLIRRRLSQHNKRILLILDDIWAEIDLEDQGIPLGGSHESLKILYTSRFRGFWHDVPTKKDIALGLLSKEEAWQLFREKAGDLADTPDLQPIAKQIVNKCGGLPLALIIFGRTLSKKSRERFIKDTWEDMCERLICPSNIPTDKALSSSLELSYNFVEDEGAKRLFLLCCLFREDESVWVEDLARFAYGLSLFDGVNEMRKVRRRVSALIDDLKSRYLLLDGESIHSESVMVHDVVRDMGISIASKDKGALVSHGAEWPKKDTYEHYTSTSVILSTITELPQGLTWENLELLMTYYNTRKKLPHNFFVGMEKLKVLLLYKMNGIPTLRSLRNLRTLTLEYGDMLPSVSDFGSLLNLEILCFNSTSIKELPEEIGELVNLRLLDLRHTNSLDRIPPGVISRLVRLEELHLMGSKFIGWEGEGKEQERRNANLRELECLSNLHTLHIVIRNDVLIPKVPIFSKLQIYTVALVDSDNHRYASLKGYEKQLTVISSNPIPLDGGGIDWLLRTADYLFLGREGCNDLVRELVRRGAVDGLQQLKNLEIVNCDTPECLVNTMNPVQRRNPNAPALFPILEKTSLYGLQNLREICRGPVPACSFRKLTQIAITNCEKLKNLFQLPIVGCLTQLKTLTLEACEGMEEVIQKEQRGDFATIRIEFPKLEYLTLAELPSLTGFCRGIDQIDFPQLKYMYLRHLGQFKCLFHNNGNLSSNSEENHSLFPQKLSLPNLEVLDIADLENLERIGHGPVSVGSLSKLKEFSVNDCGKLLCVFPSHLLPMLQDLEKLIVKRCNLLEVVFELEGVDFKEPNPEILSPLKLVELHCLPKLNYISKRDPMGFKYIQTLDIIECDSLRCVFSPTMTKIIPQLCKLKIWSCKKLSRIVAEENGLGESTMDEVEFPQLETVELRSLPNLVSFFPNMNLEKSTGHCHNPLQSQRLFNEKVAVPSLKYLELIRLENVSNLWCSELPTSSFSKLKKLEVRYCVSLRNIFHPSMARGLVNLQELLIKGCSTLEAVVGKEEEVQGGHGRKIDKTLFPQLEKLQLGSLPNLRRFCHFTHLLELPLLSEMDILFCPRMDEFSLGHVSTPNLSLPGILWNGDLNNAMQLLQKNGDDLMVISKEKPRTLDNVTDKTTPCQLAEIVDPTQLQLVVMPDSTNSAHKVAQLLYNKSGDGVLASRCNGILRLWKWGWSENNLTGKATARIVPHLWQPPNGQVMANDLTGVNLEKAVPCMALLEDGCIISACGGKFKVFDLYTFKAPGFYIPPPPASTFVAVYLQYNILAIGMEDSTIHIHNAWGKMEIKSKLKGHQKCITGLVFSTNLKILVSSGADAQLCVWTINTWEKLKSVPIQLPAAKARNGDTRLQFHSDQTRLLVSHETQLAIYNASNMDRIHQWVPQDVLPAPISSAAYSCNNQIVYTSFCDGNIGVFDADSLTLRCRIVPSAYLSSALLSGSQAVYPSVIAAHPQKPGQFAIGLTEGSVIVMERPTIRRVNGMLNGRTASSSNASNHKPDQKREEKQYWSLDDDSYSYSDDDDGDDDDDDDDSISSLSKVNELQNEVDPMSITLDDITDKTTLWPLAEIVDPTHCRLVAMPDSTNEAHKVARVLYTNSGNGVLALHCNGIIRLWKWGFGQHNRSGMATASVVPQQWQPASGLAMKNDLTGAKLEEVVPCMALTNFDRVISACGGVISKFDIMTFKVVYTYMTFSLPSTFLAVYPKDNAVKAIGMEDSTIYIIYGRVPQVQYILKGHQKRITGLAFSVNLKILVSSGADAQLCAWSLKTWDNLKLVPIQLPSGKPCNGDTRVQFHSDQILLLVSHETQLAIYDASKMDRIRQWVPQDVLPAPISCATYSCDSRLVYASFCDGNIGVFDADSLMLRCRIVPSAYLSPALSSGSKAVYPLDIAAHPHLLNQFAIGLTDGSVIIMEPPKKSGLDGGIASSSNASNQTPDQGEDVDVDEDLDEDVDEDALITTRTRTRTRTAMTGMDVDEDLDEDVDEDALITTRMRTRTATTGTHDDEEDLEEKRKEEEKEKKGKAPLLG